MTSENPASLPPMVMLTRSVPELRGPSCPERTSSVRAPEQAAKEKVWGEWAAKPVAFVSYGGAAGGRHAVLHLENVMTE
ncbi:hypothetical protein ACFXC2_14710, partial [Streptomyces lavendulae]